MYFNSIPKIYYDSQNNKRPKVVTNLLRRVGVRAKIKTNTALFDTYRVKAGETPEIIAHKLYGVTNYEYEQRRQDELREIRLLDPEYVDDFVKEYKVLMDESSI